MSHYVSYTITGWDVRIFYEGTLLYDSQYLPRGEWML